MAARRAGRPVASMMTWTCNVKSRAADSDVVCSRNLSSQPSGWSRQWTNEVPRYSRAPAAKARFRPTCGRRRADQCAIRNPIGCTCANAPQVSRHPKYCACHTTATVAIQGIPATRPVRPAAAGQTERGTRRLAGFRNESVRSKRLDSRCVRAGARLPRRPDELRFHLLVRKNLKLVNKVVSSVRLSESRTQQPWKLHSLPKRDIVV